MIETTNKTVGGRYFEDFFLGQEITHPKPRTITAGDVATYTALTGNGFVLQASDDFARAVGYNHAPIDDILLFNIIFGLSVDDISRNAIANLGYADCDFLTQISVGETVSARSTVIGLRESSNGEAGVVYVRTEGLNHRGQEILSYIRWVLIPKRTHGQPTTEPAIPPLPETVSPLTVPRHRLNRYWDNAQSGSPHRWEDYAPGERIDHIDGVTVEDAEHMMAARLYHNTARAHLNDLIMKDGAFGRRIAYGGHIISLVRALSRNGLANGCILAAIHGGSHPAPVLGGDTVYAWTEVLEVTELEGRADIGALRLRTRGIKNIAASDFPTEGKEIVLDLDYTVIMPRH